MNKRQNIIDKDVEKEYESIVNGKKTGIEKQKKLKTINQDSERVELKEDHWILFQTSYPDLKSNNFYSCTGFYDLSEDAVNLWSSTDNRGKSKKRLLGNGIRYTEGTNIIMF